MTMARQEFDALVRAHLCEPILDAQLHALLRFSRFIGSRQMDDETWNDSVTVDDCPPICGDDHTLNRIAAHEVPQYLHAMIWKDHVDTPLSVETLQVELGNHADCPRSPID